MERTRIRAVNKQPECDGGDKTVITVEVSPPAMPPVWVAFLTQRLHLLHIDYMHIGAGRIVVMAAPHAAESVVRVIISAVECADHYVRTSLRNIRGPARQGAAAPVSPGGVARR